MTKGAGRGALFGAAAGLFAAVVTKVAYGHDLDFAEATRAGLTGGVIAGGINGAGQAAARGEAAWATGPAERASSMPANRSKPRSMPRPQEASSGSNRGRTRRHSRSTNPGSGSSDSAATTNPGS